MMLGALASGRNFQVTIMSIVSARIVDARFTMKAVDITLALPMVHRICHTNRYSMISD